MAEIGRPSTYTPELGQAICDRIASGLSVTKAIDGICEQPHTFYAWMAKQPDLLQAYARARETRADARYEAIDDVKADMRAGRIDAQMARVEIDTIKWQCGKENQGRYGDRITQEHTGPGGKPLEIVVTRVAE